MYVTRGGERSIWIISALKFKSMNGRMMVDESFGYLHTQKSSILAESRGRS